MLAPGDKAPDFTCIDQHGNTVKLGDFKGHKLILYFYPKANTPGCTAESCSLNDQLETFASKGYKIVGVSADNQKAQANFAMKYGFKFPLLADTEKTLIKAYGAWGLKKLYGKEYEGIMRYTFVISEEGVIEDIITKVETKDHASQLFKALKF
jgi:peroxiredoxin Q/BCP